MTEHEFVGLVDRMRRLQREFFATRPIDRRPSLIREAKALERAVDAELARRLDTADLFGEGA